MVFHTAPPQPASKARIICSPQLVGGADASQNGFGASMRPANPCTRISGIGRLRNFQNCLCGSFAVGYSVHHFPSTIDAIAAREITRVSSLTRCWISDDASRAHLDAA